MTRLKEEQKRCLRSLAERKDVFGILPTQFPFKAGSLQRLVRVWRMNVKDGQFVGQWDTTQVNVGKISSCATRNPTFCIKGLSQNNAIYLVQGLQVNPYFWKRRGSVPS